MTRDQAFEIAFTLTAWFETNGKIYTLAVGNFDKQGCSWGPRQTCIGQGSLQPLMRKMLQTDKQAMINTLGPLYSSFVQVSVAGPTSEQLETVIKEWNDDRGRLKPEWIKALADLGGLSFVQQIFIEDAKQSIAAVESTAQWIATGDKPTLREWCLAYDFVTQNGGFNSVFKAAISTFLLALKPFSKDQRDRMRSICWLRAGWTYIRGQRQFADDVLGRKLLITEGSGKFRGEFIDLDDKFKITDEVIQ